MVSPIHANVSRNAIVRLQYPQNGDSQGQEIFLAPYADMQTCNYDTVCAQTTFPPNHHKALGLSHSRINCSSIYANIYIYIYILYIYICR